ncbi:MAG: hypothetical protein EPN22_15405 [Nitrospirae bacterium]|nr:MAG: hypothetical protein EPN22_15405 [Nitrospirota bacterium]
MQSALIYFIFAISGATALIYQIIWARWLAFSFGNTTISVSVVLACFMLGLALGSLLAGKFMHAVKNTLRFYAYMELGIGAYALCFPFIFHAIDNGYSTIVTTDTPLLISLLIRCFFSFLLLILPTTLMGTTLPLLAEFLRRMLASSVNWKVGFLYAANTIGAAIGILAASFFMIEAIGITYTTLSSGSFNILIAFVAFLYSGRYKGMPFVSSQHKNHEPQLPQYTFIALYLTAANGAIAMASEVLWTRTIETIIGNTTYAFSMIVFVYLVGISAGSWLMSFVVKKIKSLIIWLLGFQVLMGATVFISMVLFQRITDKIAEFKGGAVTIYTMLYNYYSVVSVLLPLALLSGACFPLVTRLIAPNEEEAKGTLIAKAYYWNTLGAVIGSLIAGLLIAPNLEFFNGLYFLGNLYCTAGLLACLAMVNSKTDFKRVSIAFISIPAILLVSYGSIKMSEKSFFVRNIEAKNPSVEVVSHKSGLQGVTTVIRKRKEPLAKLLLVNGMGMTVKETETKMMAHIPMLIHPTPDKTLVICFGMGSTYRSAVSYGKYVTVVELVKEVFEAFDYYHSDSQYFRDYPKGKMVVNDGRNHLKLSKDTYDVITLDPAPPIDGAGVNNLYSKDFIALAKSHLNKGGIMAHWMPFGPGSGVDDMEIFQMLVNTFTSEFPYVYGFVSYNTIGLHLIGSEFPITLSSEIIQQKLRDNKIAGDLREWNNVSLSFFNNIQMLKYNPQISVITDDKPYLEFFLIRTLKKKGKKTVFSTIW